MADIAQAPLNGQAGYGKLVAGTVASTLGGAFTTVVIAFINGVDPTYQVSSDLHGAIHTIFTTALTALAIWVTPHGR